MAGLCALYYYRGYYMKMKMPFDRFNLKLLDEQTGTHEYEEYLRNCKENPLT